MQNKLSSGLLLNEKGDLNECGYSNTLIKEYRRKDIKAGKGRIKEWDYYYIGDQEYGIALTVADNSYMGMISVSVLDFVNKTHITKSPMKWFTYGKWNIPGTSVTGDIIQESKGYSMKFFNDNGKRHLVCSLKDLAKGKDFSCDVYLEQTNENTMVIATPFNKKKHFYYNQKINCLKAKGSFKYGELEHEFNNGFGVLDWGRGVWTYSNTWYWSSLSGNCLGHNIGFNLGYGFGDTSAASENMLFVDNEFYKLDDVKFNIPQNEKGKDMFMEPWTFTSSSGDINLTFNPLFDRASNTNALIIQSDQHQVFGVFNGTFKVDGKVFEIKNLIGFAEKVKNRW